MADWFETRFREPVDAGLLDPAFAARMRALVVEEWQADTGSTRSDDTEADDDAGDIILETEDQLDLAATVAYEHHIKLNGGGYPTLSYPRACHQASSVRAASPTSTGTADASRP
jgi:hypothetical protein